MTYERNFFQEFTNYLWGIETKSIAELFNVNHSGLLITYEELKQTRHSIIESEKLKFTNYLWGIETGIVKI